MEFPFEIKPVKWHIRVRYAAKYSLFLVPIKVVEDTLAPTATESAITKEVTIFVGKDWLKENLTEEEFASYIADRIQENS